MADHYFSEMPESRHDIQSFTTRILGIDVAFSTDAGVFSRDAVDTGSRILMEALPGLDGLRVLDMGAGWGAIGVTLAKRYPTADITMAEINTRAMDLARGNLAANHTQATVIASDGFANVEGMFDCIITNPPIRAGKQVIYKMFADAADHLTPEGRLYIVIRKQHGAPSAIKYLSTMYEKVEVIEKSTGFWVIEATLGGDIR